MMRASVSAAASSVICVEDLHMRNGRYQAPVAGEGGVAGAHLEGKCTSGLSALSNIASSARRSCDPSTKCRSEKFGADKSRQ